MIKCLDIDKGDKDKKAKKFLDQAIWNLEKGWLFLHQSLYFVSTLLLY